MFHSLDHVTLAVRDLDAAARQYARLLGRTPSWRGADPATATENTLFRLDNTVLELLAPSADGVPVAPARAAGQPDLGAWLDEHGEGLLGLAFGTDDATRCRDALADRGLCPSESQKEIGRDVESGAFREWRSLSLPLEASRGVWIRAIENTSPDDVLPEAPPLGDEIAAVFALDHVVLQTRDAEETKAIYGDGLDLRLALDREFPQWGSRLLFFRVGGVTVEVAASLPRSEGVSAAGDIASSAPTDGDRLWGLSWRVRDAEAARTRLAAAGFDVSEARDGRKPGTRVFTVRDGTCGVPTLVLEPPEA